MSRGYVSKSNLVPKCNHNRKRARIFAKSLFFNNIAANDLFGRSKIQLTTRHKWLKIIGFRESLRHRRTSVCK